MPCSASVRRPRALVRIGWAMAWVAAVLLLGGRALADPWLITWGVLTLALCWVPWWSPTPRTGEPPPRH